MKNKIRFVIPKEISKLAKGSIPVTNIFRDKGIEFMDAKDLKTIIDKSMMNYFISNLHIIDRFSSKDYSKLSDIDLSTRTGSNIKVVTQVGNYRFQDNLIVDVNEGRAYRRYFLLDFNEVDSKNNASKIYELDLYSFYILISEICSAKQDIEDNIEKEDAKKYLIHMESAIRKFIKSYESICKMKEIIKN